MFNEIDFSKIDTGITPPQDDTERQYYYMASIAIYKIALSKPCKGEFAIL